MQRIALIIFGIVLLLITVYIVVYVIYPGPNNNDILDKKTPLNTKKVILTSDITKNKLLSNNGSSVMGFFYLLNGDKTAKVGNDFKSIIEIENNWYLEIAPAPSGTNKISARLRVSTNRQGAGINQEIIELPPILQQKWMFIAILRDGRRFDIIYNNEIVASQILENYPVVISSSLSIGNTGINGSVIHVIINDKRLTPTQIERERVTRVNTNNMILEADSITMNLPGLNLFGQCPPGLPCDPITKPPTNNLLQWKTPYA
jgi:hypothetical protein